MSHTGCKTVNAGGMEKVKVSEEYPERDIPPSGPVTQSPGIVEAGA